MVRARALLSLALPASRAFSSAAPPRIVIVGGVAGGATAAARARRLDEHAFITVFERGDHVSFANCGLPYYVAGEIVDRERLILSTPAALAAALNVDVRVGHEVTSIDRTAREVSVRARGDAGAHRIPYDALLLATGSAPVTHGVGAGVPNVFTLRTLNDMDAIDACVRRVTAAAAAEGRRPRAVVCGAGSVGLEMVEAFVARGLDVVLVERGAHVLPGAVDADMARALGAELESRGVIVLTLCGVAAAVAAGEGRVVVSVVAEAGAAGPTALPPADLVLLAMGVAPETALASSAGLTIDARTRAIVVDKHMRTSDPHIWAVGDAVATRSLLLPELLVCVPLGGPANRQARIAAESMLLGGAARDAYRGSLATAIVRAFDAVIGVTGLTEAAAAAAGVPVRSVTVSGASHAGYYPRAQPLTLKVLWSPGTGRLLGAQCSGGVDGVDKRIDVLATAIAAGATFDDLAHLELSYAPPFGAARDVVNVAGFAAQNIEARWLLPARTLAPTTATTAKPSVIVDVRDADTAALRPVRPTSADGRDVLRIPLEQLRGRLAEVRDAAAGGAGGRVTAVCELGKLSYMASRIMQQRGVPGAASLVGGLAALPPSVAEDAAKRANALALAVRGGSGGGGSGGGGSGGGDGGHAAPAAAPAPMTTAGAARAALPAAPAAAPLTAPLATLHIDACGLACPGPIMALRKALPSLAPGQEMEVTATDAGFASDFPALCGAAGMQVLGVRRERGIVTGRLRRPATVAPPVARGAATAALSSSPEQAAHAAASLSLSSVSPAAATPQNPHDLAIVVFSGELDKVLAALVIANGAVAMGATKVTLFFTFWGLSALRDPAASAKPAPRGGAATAAVPPVSQSAALSAVDAALGAMLPRGPGALHLSHLDFGGVGARMMERVMDAKHLPTLPGLLREARESGVVRLVACTMSMAALGVHERDLLTGVELGGVADFLAAAAAAKTTLFI